MDTIELNLEETHEITSSPDFYSRIWMGQYGEMLLCTGYLTGIFGDDPIQHKLEDIVRRMRDVTLPSTRHLGMSGFLGIWSNKTDDRAICAYDMKQVIRFARAWHLHPEGGMTVDFYTPWIRGSLPEVTCSCMGSEEDFMLTLQAEPLGLALVVEALEVYGLGMRGQIAQMMDHFTDSPEALELATATEPLFRKVADEAGWIVFGEGDDRIPKLRSRLLVLPGVAEQIETVRKGTWRHGTSDWLY